MKCIWCESFKNANVPNGTKSKCFVCWRLLIKLDPLDDFTKMFGSNIDNPFTDMFNK